MENQNVWLTYDENSLEQVSEFAAGYMDFLNRGKTERDRRGLGTAPRGPAGDRGQPGLA